MVEIADHKLKTQPIPAASEQASAAAEVPQQSQQVEAKPAASAEYAQGQAPQVENAALEQLRAHLRRFGVMVEVVSDAVVQAVAAAKEVGAAAIDAVEESAIVFLAMLVEQAELLETEAAADLEVQSEKVKVTKATTKEVKERKSAEETSLRLLEGGLRVVLSAEAVVTEDLTESTGSVSDAPKRAVSVPWAWSRESDGGSSVWRPQQKLHAVTNEQTEAAPAAVATEANTAEAAKSVVVSATAQSESNGLNPYAEAAESYPTLAPVYANAEMAEQHVLAQDTGDLGDVAVAPEGVAQGQTIDFVAQAAHYGEPDALHSFAQHELADAVPQRGERDYIVGENFIMRVASPESDDAVVRGAGWSERVGSQQEAAQQLTSYDVIQAALGKALPSMRQGALAMNSLIYNGMRGDRNLNPAVAFDQGFDGRHHEQGGGQQQQGGQQGDEQQGQA